MNRKKALGAAVLLTMLLAVVFIAPWGAKRADAVTETCSGVATTFNATAPASVTAGQAFTVSGISSTPTTSYGFTITTSTLSLSATAATPGAYNQANTSTDPSPTTGAPTYTAYYPSWTLTATGAAGSQIVIKLVQASATVSGVGVINCPLTSTLVTVNVTAPTSSSPSSPGSTTKPTSSPSSTTTPQPTTPAAPTPITTPTETKQSTKDTSAQIVPMKVLVVNNQKQPIKDVPVTIDGQLTVKTGADGTARFTGIRKGAHTVSMVFGKQKLSRQVEAATASDKPATTFVVSTRPSTAVVVSAGVGVLVLLGATFLAVKFYKGRREVGRLAR
jgi:hypothetical protein